MTARGEKVFGIGLSKTGNTSLATALKYLGLRIKKFPTDFTDMNQYDGATDTPVAANYELLDYVFPKSRFILTIRAKDDWLESCRKMWARQQAFFDSCDYISQMHQQVFGSRTFDEPLFSAAYNRHYDAVHRHFADRPDALLVLNICGSGTAWSPLCRFLNVNVPDVPVPHENSEILVSGLIAHIAKQVADENLAAELCGVNISVVRQAIHDAALRSSIPTSELMLDANWEIRHILESVAVRYGSVSNARIALNLPRQDS